MDSKRHQQHCQHPMCIYVHIVPCAHSQFGSAVKVPNMSANYSEHLDMLSIEKNSEELVEVIRHRRRLPKETDMCNKVTYQMLRTAMMTDFPKHMAIVLPPVEQILGHLVFLQHTRYQGVSWVEHWKEVSHEGFDMSKGRCIDYGNKEYYMLLGCFCSMSPYCYQCMEHLGQQYFPSLHPQAMVTDHNMEMSGDVVEICMAALRGHDDFAAALNYVSNTPGALPQLFNSFCIICRCVQIYDACFRTRWIKWQDKFVWALVDYMPDMKDQPFIVQWKHRGVLHRRASLQALLKVCSSAF